MELPEESVGAKVKCPVCETSFVSNGNVTVSRGDSIEEWMEQTNLRFRSVTQSYTADEKQTLDFALSVLAEARFDHAKISNLEVNDIIKSPLGLLLLVDCPSSSVAVLEVMLAKEFCGNKVYRDIPGQHGVGVLVSLKGYDYNRDDALDFDAIHRRVEWQRLSSDSTALPALLGVDFLNRDLILNLADFNCLYVTGGDTLAQSRRLDVIVKGMLSCRSVSQLRFLELNFMDGTWVAPQKYIWGNCCNEVDKNSNKDWKRDVLKYISLIKAEKEKRKKLFRDSNCDHYNQYCERHVFPRIVIIVQVGGLHLRNDEQMVFKAISEDLLSSDLRDYGIHLILVDYEPSRLCGPGLNGIGFPEYVYDVAGTGFLSGGVEGYLESLIAFGTSDARQRRDDYQAVYKSPDGEVCEFQFAKFRG